MIWSLFFHAKWLSRLGLFDVLKLVLLNVLEVHSLPDVLKVFLPDVFKALLSYVLKLVLSVVLKVFLPDVLKALFPYVLELVLSVVLKVFLPDVPRHYFHMYLSQSYLLVARYSYLMSSRQSLRNLIVSVFCWLKASCRASDSLVNTLSNTLGGGGGQASSFTRPSLQGDIKLCTIKIIKTE